MFPQYYSTILSLCQIPPQRFRITGATSNLVSVDELPVDPARVVEHIVPLVHIDVQGAIRPNHPGIVRSNEIPSVRQHPARFSVGQVGNLSNGPNAGARPAACLPPPRVRHSGPAQPQAFVGQFGKLSYGMPSGQRNGISHTAVSRQYQKAPSSPGRKGLFRGTTSIPSRHSPSTALAGL